MDESLTTAIPVPASVVVPSRSKRNVRISTIKGMLLREDVTEIRVDSNGLWVTRRDTVTRKVGEEMKDFTNEVHEWFNAVAVLSWVEEFPEGK